MSGVRAVAITLHRVSRALEVKFDDGVAFTVPAVLLRVYSPSAEVQGHAPERRVLAVDKRGVTIVAIEPIGHYAVRLRFDDGHQSGIYTWQTLYDLGMDQHALNARYLDALVAAGGVVR